MSSGAFGCCCILVAAVGFVAYMFTTDTMAVDPIYWLKENDLQEYTAYFQSHGVTMEEVILYEKSDIEAISSTAGVGNRKNMKFRTAVSRLRDERAAMKEANSSSAWIWWIVKWSIIMSIVSAILYCIVGVCCISIFAGK
eukprot:426094_1